MALDFAHLAKLSQGYFCRFGSGYSLSQRQKNGVKHPNRIRELRRARGWSLELLAEKLNMSTSFVSRLERGERNFTLKQMDAFARAFGVQATELLPSHDTEGLSGAPVLNPEGHVVGLRVPLVGYAGAGSKAHIYNIPEQYLGDVPAIDGATDKTVAVEIRGDSLGETFNNWIAYYDDVRRPVTSDLHRKLCVVGLDDDRIFIKKLHPTPTPGVYDLISEKKDETIEGVHVKWAAKVKAMTPR
jgi:transcriptional regulator with XRE-family HTH domain